MKKEDSKALRKAIGRQPEFRLPSNFTYRMMQQVEQEAFLRKKRNEKRIFILWAATLILMGGSALAYLVLTYMKNLSGIEETLKNIPEDSSLLQINPEKPDVPLNKNDAFQKVQKRHVQEKR